MTRRFHIHQNNTGRKVHIRVSAVPPRTYENPTRASLNRLENLSHRGFCRTPHGKCRVSVTIVLWPNDVAVFIKAGEAMTNS